MISDGAIVQRADGYGWLVGDEGSAVWLGREAVRAALAAYDGRGSPTLLTESVPRALLGGAVVAEIDTGPRHRHHRALALVGAPSLAPGSPVLTPGVPPQGGGTGTAVLIPGAARPPAGESLDRAAQHEPISGPPPNPQLAQAIIKEVYGLPPAALGLAGPVVAAAATAA